MQTEQVFVRVVGVLVYVPVRIDVVGIHSVPVGIFPVLVLIGARLDAAVQRDHGAFLEILAYELGGVAPAHDVDEVSLPFLSLLHKAAVHRNGEACHAHPLRGLAHFRVSRQTAHKGYNIQCHFSPPNSSFQTPG